MESNYDIRNNTPPSLTVEEISHIDDSHIDPSATGIHDALTRMLGEARYDIQWWASIRMNKNTLAGPSNWSASRMTVKDDDPEGNEPRSKQTSPALTKDLHLRYPYRENLGNNEDLPQNNYPRPYITAQVNQASGDPRVRGERRKRSPHL
jgi:hypothetical protein